MGALGLSERELAELVGMSHTTLWRRIANPDGMRVEELIRVAEVLQLSGDDVLGLVGMKGLQVVG